MWGSLSAAVFVSVFLLPAVSQSHSALPEDLEGSGYDLDSSGSGSGDGWEQVSPDEITNIKIQPNSYGGRICTKNTGGGNKNASPGSSDLTSDSTRWPATVDESEFVFFESSKRFWENEEILAALIAGGVAGVTIAVALSAVLIHKQQKKGKEGNILGGRRASDEDYHKPIRDAVIV